MARIPRRFSVVAGHCVHKVWRGHNKEWNIHTATDKLSYLKFLNEDIELEKYQQGSFLQALTLMSNHTHEMSFITEARLFSNHMRRHHARYGAWFNRVNNRCGKVAQDRPHTSLIEDDHNQMEVVFYIHANPLRAKMVDDLRQYHWSTHQLYAFGKRPSWMKHVRLPRWYLNLGSSDLLRQRAYRKLFAHFLKARGLVKQPFSKSRFVGSIVWMGEEKHK